MIEKPADRHARVAGGTRRGGGLRRIPDLLGKMLDPAARRRGLAEGSVLAEWPTIVGAALAARCQPVKLTGSDRGAGGTLHVHVSGAAAIELQHSEPQLLERINGYFGYPAVARLHLTQVPVARPRRAAPPAPPVPDASLRAEIEAAVQPIGDEGLRAALAALGAAIRARRGRQAAGARAYTAEPLQKGRDR